MNISVIGTGNMGRAVARGLLSAGHQVTVYNRTRRKAELLVQQGARVVATAAEAICASAHTIVLLQDASSARSVLLSSDVRQALRGKALMSAVGMGVDEFMTLSDEIAREGGRLSDGMIATFPAEVERRQAEFIIASYPEDAADWLRIFQDLGPTVHDVGALGNASRATMSFWLSHVFVRVAIGYAVAAFEKQNLPPDLLRSALSGNPAVALPQADYIVTEMVKRTYGSEDWTVDMTVQSIDQAIEFATKLGIDSRVMVEIRELYAKASMLGFGARDANALYEVLNPRASG